MTLLIRNAEIYAPGNPTAMLIAEGKVAWLGNESAASNLAKEHEVLDGEGNWLAPAFVDGHAHLVNTGLAFAADDLRSARNASELSVVVKRAATDSAIVFLHGWDDGAWPEPATAPSALPEIDIPIYASRIDLHSALVNPALVARVPQVMQDLGWHPSGLVTAEAHARVRTWALSQLGLEQRLQAGVRALEDAAVAGICAVHEMSGPVVASREEAAGLRAFADRALPEVLLWWGELGGFDTARELGAIGCGGDLFVDGSIGSKTACFHEPYADGASGNAYLSESQVLEHIQQANHLRVPTSFHAIGDAAIDAVAAAHSAAGRGIGHRVEHLMAATPSAIDRLAAAGVAASVQPQFDARWAGEGGMYEERLGERWRGLHPLPAFGRAGMLTILGSDSPVTPMRPWANIAAATNMHVVENSIGLKAAFAAHTRSSWRQSGRTDVGEIAVGQLASLALWRVRQFAGPEAGIGRWSADPRAAAPRLPDPTSEPDCLALWRDGVEIHRDAAWR